MTPQFCSWYRCLRAPTTAVGRRGLCSEHYDELDDALGSGDALLAKRKVLLAKGERGG